MKNKLILLSLLGLTMAQAQVGINTDEPNATLDVKYTNGTSAQGVLFPTMTKEQRDAMVAPPQGLTIFNSSVPCLQTNLGTPDKPEWHCAGSTGGSSGVGSTSGSGGNTGATPITVPPTVKIKKGERMFASIYDEDYLPYTKPGGAATFGAVAADGNNESKIIDYQGIIPTGGVAVNIPVEVSGGQVTLPAYTSGDLEITADKTQDGQARNLVLSWESQTLTSQSKIIKATLKSKNGDLLIKKLDINGGVGNDSKGILLGTYTLPQADGATAQPFEIRVISGIPDKSFGVMTNGKYEHRFLYLPITGPDGKVWLNNNLGASYSNIDSPDFNPAQQGTSATDHKSYGSLFQWGRLADGHELIKWTSSTSGGAVHDLGWRSYSQLTESAFTDPCPADYHMPRQEGLISLHSALTGVSDSGTAFSNIVWADNILRLPASGRRLNQDGEVDQAGQYGQVWAAAPYGAEKANNLFFDNTLSYVPGNATRSYGFGVRCIQD